jgi:xylulokinase
MKILSIDVGTSSVKAAVFNLKGDELASAIKVYDMERSRSGWVEVDPRVYWEKTKDAIKEVTAKTGHPGDIRAVGVTGQGETLILLNKKGRPVRNAVVWLDTRAVKEAGDIEKYFGADRIYEVTGQNETSAGYTASMILWLKRNEPESFKSTSKFLLVTDYIIYQLTGRYVSNKALYPSTLYYDFRRERWWNEMLDFISVKENALPSLVDSGIVAGKMHCTDIGISQDAVVCPAPIDQITGALGAGNFQPGIISESTGTVLAICGTTDLPVYDRDRRFCLFPHAVKGKFVAMPWASSSGSILTWFKDRFCPEMGYEQMVGEAEKVAAGSEGLTVLPHFEGINYPRKIVDARGVFWGITLTHQRKHFIRAIMESVAYLLKDYISVLEENGIGGDKVISLGGAARSELWSQIKSDVLRKKVVVNRVSETVCLGASMIASVGAGFFDNCKDASSHMSKRGRSFMPTENAGRYQSLYEDYRRLNKLSEVFFKGGELDDE